MFEQDKRGTRLFFSFVVCLLIRLGREEGQQERRKDKVVLVFWGFSLVLPASEGRVCLKTKVRLEG